MPELYAPRESCRGVVEPDRSRLDSAIHRVRLDKLRIFEISEAELEALERGSIESIFLNLGIAALSTAVSLTVSLASATVSNDRTFYVLVIVTAVAYVSATAFGLLWFVSRRSLRSVSTAIRSRIPPEGIQEDGAGLCDE